MKKTGFEVKPEERQSWGSIAMVWVGSMICVPCLMVGGMLSGTGGLSMVELVTSIILGYVVICAYMIPIGMQACDTGLPISQIAQGALGEKGAKYLISLLLTISCVGWFGIQSAVCGGSFASMIFTMTGFQIPVWISSIVWGGIMLATACAGFSGLKVLNYIAVPALVLVCGYGVFAAVTQNDGGVALANYTASNSLGMVFGISMTVGSFALGGVISADYCRYAKSRADVAKSSLLGVVPAGFAMLFVGAVLSIMTGQYDITAILASVGVPFFGLIALVLATWTTNVTNAYSGGLALSNLLGFNESKFTLTTAIAGGIGTLLAAFGLLDRFAGFLSLMSALIPPLAGVVIADYWILCKGNVKNFDLRAGVNAPGLIAFLIGAVVACATGGSFAGIPVLGALNFPFFIGPVNGIVVSFILYAVLGKVMTPAPAAIKEH